MKGQSTSKRKEYFLNFLGFLAVLIVFALTAFVECCCISKIYHYHTCDKYATGAIKKAEKRSDGIFLKIEYVTDTGCSTEFEHQTEHEGFNRGDSIPVRYKTGRSFVNLSAESPDHLALAIVPGLGLLVPTFWALSWMVGDFLCFLAKPILRRAKEK